MNEAMTNANVGTAPPPDGGAKDPRTTIYDSILAQFGMLLSVEDVAILFGVHPQTVYKNVRRGTFPVIPVDIYGVKFSAMQVATYLHETFSAGRAIPKRKRGRPRKTAQ